MQLLKSYWWLLLLIALVIVCAIVFIPGNFRNYKPPPPYIKGYEWNMPDTNRIPATAAGDLIRYGKELVVNTAIYLGPKGKLGAMSNGMNCQNCHLDAGSRLWGNNFSGVFANYPKFKQRSGSIESIYNKINDCFERSLNGKSLDTNSREMQAIYAYIKWLGENVPRNIKPGGSGIADIPFINRPADSSLGKIVYIQKCQRCHALDGAGTYNMDSTAYQYPPLWGPHSYNTGASLYRLGRFAGYVKYNMPFDSKEEATKLRLEEAWNVAAFVNSQPRPSKKFPGDWPDISTKPFDHPFGPYSDGFNEMQHKYGAFGPIAKAKKTKH